VKSVEIDPVATRDLVYQINRPTPSRALGGDARLNRLMKWSAPSFRISGMQLTPTGMAPAGQSIEDIYAGLDDDTNTPAERTEPLPRDSLGAIYDELIDLSWKTLALGEKI
jgi:hypothetical protein